MGKCFCCMVPNDSTNKQQRTATKNQFNDAKEFHETKLYHEKIMRRLLAVSAPTDSRKDNARQIILSQLSQNSTMKPSVPKLRMRQKALEGHNHREDNHRHVTPLVLLHLPLHPRDMGGLTRAAVRNLKLTGQVIGIPPMVGILLLNTTKTPASRLMANMPRLLLPSVRAAVNHHWQA